MPKQTAFNEFHIRSAVRYSDRPRRMFPFGVKVLLAIAAVVAVVGVIVGWLI